MNVFGFTFNFRVPSLLLCIVIHALPIVHSRNIVVGEDPSQFSLEWVDGACYLPIKNVRVGDTLEFRFTGHNVHKMKSKTAFDNCKFGSDDSELLSFESPFKYTVTAEDASPGSLPLLADNTNSDVPYRSLYFACSVGAHCLGKQKVRVDVDLDFSDITAGVRIQGENPSNLNEGEPISKFLLNVNDKECARIQDGENPDNVIGDIRPIETFCEEPVKKVGDDGKETWTRTCLSPKFTLTPGGVINQAAVVSYPFPKDHRIVLGRRIWEFVQGDLDNLQTVPVNQLYVHHILGNVIQGNGAESINRSDEDTTFPSPYGRLSGDFNDVMTFHLIDLRETGDDWLPCLECRCKDKKGGFLGIGGSGGDGIEDTGGVSCCTNCTSLTSPTIDYRMRYNVSWTEVSEDEPITRVVGITTDMAAALNKVVEWDVPYYENLPENQRHPTDPKIQLLERVGPLKTIFSGTSFSKKQDFDMFEIHRCIGHMHIGGLEASIKIARTDESVCNIKATYGKDPLKDENFLTSIDVESFDPPLLLSGDEEVRVTVHYNASELHTGVMGLFTLFVSDHDYSSIIHHDETSLTVDLCEASQCDPSLLPNIDEISLRCEDDVESTILCRFGGICTCDSFLSLPFIVGGCDLDGKLVLPPAYGNRTFPVLDVCAKSCGCKHLEDEELRKELLMLEIKNSFTDMYKEACSFATKDCEKMLSNLYTCSKNTNADDPLDPMLREALVELHNPTGQDVNEEGILQVMKRAQLGNRKMHDSVSLDMDKEIFPCSNIILVNDDVEEARDVEPSTSGSLDMIHGCALLMSSSALLAFLLA